MHVCVCVRRQLALDRNPDLCGPTTPLNLSASVLRSVLTALGSDCPVAQVAQSSAGLALGVGGKYPG